MKTLHLRKCKGEPGWEIADFSVKKGAQILWSANKKVLLRIMVGYFKGVATKADPLSLRIHGTDGKFKEERTYPKSADPKNTKG